MISSRTPGVRPGQSFRGDSSAGKLRGPLAAVVVIALIAGSGLIVEHFQPHAPSAPEVIGS